MGPRQLSQTLSKEDASAGGGSGGAEGGVINLQRAAQFIEVTPFALPTLGLAACFWGLVRARDYAAFIRAFSRV
jgi:hypothetical protein